MINWLTPLIITAYFKATKSIHYRISHLTEHMKLNRKDYSTERALTMLVGKRRRLLDYLKARDIERYRAIVKELGLRK